MGVTIDDVAAAAGVGRSTVSRALSGHPSVSPEARERVLAAARELDYRADPVARALRVGSSGLIGLVLTNLMNPSIQQIAETIQQLGHENDMEVVIATTNGSFDRERRVISALTSHRVNGLIVMGSAEGAPALNALHAGGLPLVELIRLPEQTRTPSVVYDDRAAGRMATEHLLDHGHRAIAFLGGPAGTRSGDERHRGYHDALAARGLSPVAGEEFRGAFDSAFGTEAMSAFARARQATAIVVANHEAAFGALQTLAQSGVDVPGELSIVAVEDDPLLQFWHPAVTAVDTLPVELARTAMATLQAQLTNPADRLPPSPTAPQVIPVRLLERGSVAAPRG